jgi:hypothetical protein
MRETNGGWLKSERGRVRERERERERMMDGGMVRG